MKRIHKAINEALNPNNSLILFDDDEPEFGKSSKLGAPMMTIANMIVDKCIETNSMNIELYEQIVRDAWYQVSDKELLIALCELTIECAGYECDLNWINTSQITDMSLLFEIIEQFNCDISNWDVSNVKDMNRMFNGCINFNLDLSEWDVSNVTDMTYMFSGCNNFNLDLSGWDVSNVKDMSFMFNGCINFNLDLSRWDTRNVKNMFFIFYGCPMENECMPDFKC